MSDSQEARKLAIIPLEFIEHRGRCYVFPVVILQPLVSSNVADRAQCRRPPVSRPLGDLVGNTGQLIGMLIGQQVITAELPARHMPVNPFSKFEATVLRWVRRTSVWLWRLAPFESIRDRQRYIQGSLPPRGAPPAIPEDSVRGCRNNDTPRPPGTPRLRQSGSSCYAVAALLCPMKANSSSFTRFFRVEGMP